MNTTRNPQDSNKNHSSMSPAVNMINNNSNHIMLSTQAQQVNNTNHITPHLIYSNQGNHMMENNKHNHNTTIYNSNKDNNSYYNNRQNSDDNSIEDMTITADMIIESISNASNDNTQRLYTQSIYIPGSNTSYTGTGANELEHPILQGVEQARYPLESAIRVTSAGNVTLPAPQSSGWATRTGHGSYAEKPQERPARQADQVDTGTTQTPERTAQTRRSARKRKECPTEEEQRYNRSRRMECTQTTNNRLHTI